ncbi:MAG: 50S ribosomal protein L17 [Candidatus Pacebacteria bacterium]|jgi:large subunit ribosomal protein L17|nr:50S ribosomal protein L17 [Candidatus Paceibacterota bacterium]
MRHHNSVRKFGRKKNQRNALLKSLALSLVKSGKITTTEAKAKELRPFIEKLVTKGKTPTVASRRNITAKLQNRKPEVKKLVDEVAKKYEDRKGGYTRIMKLPRRKSDGSKMAVIEFV